MAKVSGRILKSEDVRLEGQFHLDLAQAASAPGGHQPRSGVPAAPQARVLENNPEYAVIEVTCTCGASTRLRCEYAGTRAKNSATEVSNETK